MRTSVKPSIAPSPHNEELFAWRGNEEVVKEKVSMQKPKKFKAPNARNEMRDQRNSRSLENQLALDLNNS